MSYSTLEEHWFLSQLKGRLATGRNILGGVVGDQGQGKTYWALKIAEAMDPNFTVDNVVFTTRAFIKRAWQIKRGGFLVYDEPGVDMSNRMFMSQMNRLASFFLQSSRYTGKVNAIFAVPSLYLMDLAARTILLFMANMEGRGIATVYRIERNQFSQNPPYRTVRAGVVMTGKPQPALAEAYEEKRRAWHEQIFKNDLEDSGPEQAPQPIFNIQDKVQAHPELYLDAKGKISAKKIIATHGVSYQTAYKVKAIVEAKGESANNKPTIPTG